MLLNERECEYAMHPAAHINFLIYHQVVTHYMTHHGYIPLWVLVNVLTFGKITNFYFIMKTDDKRSVAKFFSVDVKELHK